jgi:copper transport protein
VVSLDGHPVGGSVVFSIGEASVLPPLDTSAAEGFWRVVWIAVRATLTAGLLGSAGGVLFLLLVAEGGAAAAATTSRLVGAFALIGIVAAALSIGIQGCLLAGAPLRDIISPALWRTGAESAFGRSALLAILALVVLTIGLRLPAAAGRMIAFGGAVLALISFVFAGHVVTAGPRWLTVPALVAHTSAVAFWVGSLLPLRLSLAGEGAAATVRQFSTIAVAAVAILITAGLVIAALQVRGFAALFTTTYGWLLLGKLILVSGLLSLAAVNKWRLTPALARRMRAQRLRFAGRSAPSSPLSRESSSRRRRSAPPRRPAHLKAVTLTVPTIILRRAITRTVCLSPWRQPGMR